MMPTGRNKELNVPSLMENLSRQESQNLKFVFVPVRKKVLQCAVWSAGCCNMHYKREGQRTKGGRNESNNKQTKERNR